jgi:hypothetical protein
MPRVDTNSSLVCKLKIKKPLAPEEWPTYMHFLTLDWNLVLCASRVETKQWVPNILRVAKSGLTL